MKLVPLDVFNNALVAGVYCLRCDFVAVLRGALVDSPRLGHRQHHCSRNTNTACSGEKMDSGRERVEALLGRRKAYGHVGRLDVPQADGLIVGRAEEIALLVLVPVQPVPDQGERGNADG